MPTPHTEVVTDLRDAAGVGLNGELLATVKELVRFPSTDLVFPGLTTTFKLKEGVAYKVDTLGTNRMTLPATAVGTPADVPVTLVYKSPAGEYLLLGDFVIPDSPTPVNLADLTPVVPVV